MDSTPAPTPDAEAGRQHVGLRIAATKIATYDQLAINASRPGARITRTDVIKAHLAIAERHADEVTRLLEKIAEGRA